MSSLGEGDFCCPREGRVSHLPNKGGQTVSWNTSSPRQEHFPPHSTSAGLGTGSHLAGHDPSDIKRGNPTHTGLGIFLFPGNGCKFRCKCPCKWSRTAILISGPNLNIPSLVESRFSKNSLRQPPTIRGFSSSSLNPVPGRVFRIRSAMGTGGWGPSLHVPLQGGHFLGVRGWVKLLQALLLCFPAHFKTLT